MKFAHLFPFLLLGCSSWNPHSTAFIYIDSKNFSPEQIDAIHQVTDEWQDALDDYITFEYIDVDQGVNTIKIASCSVEWLQENHGTIGETYYVPWANGGHIVLPTDVKIDFFKRDFRHEMGHALGLTHDPQENTIMYYSLKHESDQISCRDVIQFCDKNDCNADFYPPCTDY